MHSGIIAAIAVVFARYAGHFGTFGPLGTRIVAVAAIVGLSLFNSFGVRPGSRLQTTVTIAKLLAIAVRIGAGLLLAVPSGLHDTAGTQGDVSLANSVLALLAGLFAYGGWHMVTYTAGETVDPERTIPRALVVGVAIVTLCYVALNAIYLRVLPLDRLIGSTRVAADAAEALVGGVGATLVSLLVLI